MLSTDLFCDFPDSLRPVFRQALKEKLKKENGLEGVEVRFFSRCTLLFVMMGFFTSGFVNLHILMNDYTGFLVYI